MAICFDGHEAVAARYYIKSAPSLGNVPGIRNNVAKDI